MGAYWRYRYALICSENVDSCRVEGRSASKGMWGRVAKKRTVKTQIMGSKRKGGVSSQRPALKTQRWGANAKVGSKRKEVGYKRKERWGKIAKDGYETQRKT